MSTTGPISRRTVLRGLGTAVALPWLEAMAPAAALAARRGRRPRPPRRGWPSSTSPTASTCRTGRPTAEGADFELPDILEPLAPFKDDLLVLSGLAQRQRPGPTATAPATTPAPLAAFLTGCQPAQDRRRGHPGRASRSTRSPPQTVGDADPVPLAGAGLRPRRAGRATATPAIAAPTRRTSPGGRETTPVAKEVNPRLVFERLFAGSDPDEPAEAAAKRERYQQEHPRLRRRRRPPARRAGSARPTGASSTST